MKRYGLRIGETGVEFSTKDDRDKALLCFTKGGTVKVNPRAGVRYQEDGDPCFGTYERESNEVLVNCAICEGTFSSDGCSQRTYPYKASYDRNYSDRTGHICDGCFAKQVKDKELHEAKEKLEAAGQA